MNFKITEQFKNLEQTTELPYMEEISINAKIVETEPAIYYINRAKAYKTNLTFNQYYEAVLDMLGISDWQYLFTDVSVQELRADGIYQNLKAALQALQKVFPQKDYSRYFELLDRR
jgi:uncharacterized protein YutD